MQNESSDHHTVWNGPYDLAGNVWEWTADLYRDHRQAMEPCCAFRCLVRSTNR